MELLVLLLTYMYLQYGQATEQEVVYGIGFKLCYLKCIQRGSCMSFAYNIDRLVCRLSHKDDTSLTKDGYVIHPKKRNQASAGACSLANCGPGTRCVERHGGNTVCVEGLVSDHTVTNIAQGKPTTESSYLNNPGSSGVAVDGNKDPYYYQGSCTHTAFSYPAWWIVDLQHIYTIDFIVIYNRATSQQRLDNTTIEGFLHYPATCDNPVPSSSTFHAGPSGAVVNVSFAQETRAQFIRISRNGIVTLCEVEVYGTFRNDQGRLNSIPDEKPGKKLSAPAVVLGREMSQGACLQACVRLPNCYIINHNAKTGECHTATGLVKNDDFSRSSDWNLYFLC